MIERTRRPDKRKKYEAELACPPLPPALAYLWVIYGRLRRRKSGTGFGPSTIEWVDIDAFTRQLRMRLAPWEIEILEEIDDLFLTTMTSHTSTTLKDTQNEF